MKSLFVFLKFIIFSCFLYTKSYASTEFYHSDYYYGDTTVLDFMPGQKQFIKEERISVNGIGCITSYLRDLKEFKIRKNGKYCLWGSKNWDEECQNVAMEYAYGTEWLKFKKLAISFLKHIKNEEYDKAIALTKRITVFVEEDDENNSLDDRKTFKVTKQIYINPTRQRFEEWEENLKRKGIIFKERLADEFDITILKNILKDVEPDQLKFYISCINKSYNYYCLMIPYLDEGIPKYFYITFTHRQIFLKDYPEYSLGIGELGIYKPQSKYKALISKILLKITDIIIALSADAFE